MSDEKQSNDLDGVQVDLYGVKAHVKPTGSSEPDPPTWGEVA